MGDILVIQNTRLEGSGLLGTLMQQDGFKLDSVYAKHESISQLDHDMLLVLGAPESVNDDLDYLRKEEELIRKFTSKDKPVLGICLGSQLIAHSFGGTVYHGSKKEIGFYHDLEPSTPSRLFSEFSNPFTVFHWHGDTFDLPENATRLVHSKDYQNQAFQIHSAVGIQFHLEVDESMVNLWLDNTQERLAKIPYIDPLQIRLDVPKYMDLVNSNLGIFYRNFKLEFNL